MTVLQNKVHTVSCNPGYFRREGLWIQRLRLPQSHPRIYVPGQIFFIILQFNISGLINCVKTLPYTAFLLYSLSLNLATTHSVFSK